MILKKINQQTTKKHKKSPSMQRVEYINIWTSNYLWKTEHVRICFWDYVTCLVVVALVNYTLSVYFWVTFWVWFRKQSSLIVVLPPHWILSLCMLGNIWMLLLASADFFKINFFSKNSLRNTIMVSNGLDPDQDRHDLGPNCLKRLSADHKNCQLRVSVTPCLKHRKLSCVEYN